MNEKIRQHLVAHATKNNWPTDNDTLIEIITESDDVYRKKVSDSRWWYTEFIVTEVDGMLIGYEYASANRDEHVRDLGWEFDESTICQVEPVEKTVIVYKKVKTAVKDSVNIDMNILDPNAPQVPANQEAIEQQAATESAEQDKAMEVQDSEEVTEG